MKITVDKLLNIAKKHQIDILIEQGRLQKSSIPYMAPEILPDIKSSQVLALIRALVEVLNNDLE